MSNLVDFDPFIYSYFSIIITMFEMTKSGRSPNHFFSFFFISTLSKLILTRFLLCKRISEFKAYRSFCSNISAVFWHNYHFTYLLFHPKNQRFKAACCVKFILTFSNKIQQNKFEKNLQSSYNRPEKCATLLKFTPTYFLRKHMAWPCSWYRFVRQYMSWKRRHHVCHHCYICPSQRHRPMLTAAITDSQIVYLFSL